MAGNTIPLFKVHIADEEHLWPRLRSVLYSGQISEGPVVPEFERRFSDFVAIPNVLSFYSGTAALHTALFLAGVRPGDEVISTPMTAEPTNLAVLHAGGRPVWADVDPANGNLAPDSVRELVTERTRAIVVVHYGGIPASMGRLGKIAAECGLPVIEDCAHALGARYAGKHVGAGSEFAMFSLQAIKHMTTVDGGMLSCRDPKLLPVGRKFRWFGIDRNAPRTDVDVETVGYKYHMNDVTAALGLVQLEPAGGVLASHVANGRYFDQALRGIPGVDVCAWDEGAEPSYWFYTVMAEDSAGLQRKLTEQGIGGSKVHRRNDAHSVFSSSRRHLPGLDRFYSRMLHIPCGWWVTPEDRERIAATIRAGW